MTMTNTPVITATTTNTATTTPTPTPAPCQVWVYPNPMDFTAPHNEAYVPSAACPTGKCIIFSCLPLNATVRIYTVSLALVRSFDSTVIQTNIPNIPDNTGLIAWDGTNGNGSAVASGLYFYVVSSLSGNTFGKFAISKSINGP
jgi:hypothetical protein